LEYQLETLVDVLTAHALKAGAGGQAVITAELVAVRPSPGLRVALVDELVNESQEPTGWHVAGTRALQPPDHVTAKPMTSRVPLASMQDVRARLRAAYDLASELLALFAIDEPTLLKADGTMDPYGATVQQQQIVYQHANHLGLPVDDVSPGERRSRYEATIKAARDELRKR
jgi:hypothetical protein